MDYDASAWSGEGAFTRTLLDALGADPSVAFVRVEDAPASREDSAFSFISNEIFVGFTRRDDGRPLATLAEALERVGAIGAPDYADETMLQYLARRACRAAVPDARRQGDRDGPRLRGRQEDLSRAAVHLRRAFALWIREGLA